MARLKQLSCFWYLLAFAGLCFLESHNSVTAEDVLPSKLSQNVGAPTLKFLYW